MSTKRDRRVVEMSFDNKDFEKNAATSLSTIEKLKKALDFSGVTNSFNSLESAVKVVNLDPVINSVNEVKEKFSTLGIMGKRVLENLADAAVNAGKKIWDNTLGQIQSGGSARALNIANAQFKLEGLGVAWEKAEKDISQAVDGTAYGFDAAANTASQLATAGIELGDTYGGMAHSLRAVSGIAAMTNSSYEEIGYIFSQIASAGRLMGQDAMQISQRGINVTATLAKQLNKTTAEVQEMQRKGEISFAMFAEAMNDAFGDQATKANNTFQGAMSNVKAALSRIGEIFYGPFYDSMIKPLNKIREAINNIKKAFDDGDDATRDFKDRLSDVLKIASELFSYFVQKANFDSLYDAVDGLNEIMESLIHVGNMWKNFLGIVDDTDSATVEIDGLKKSIKDISDEELELAKRVINGEFGNGDERIRRLKELTENYELVQLAVNECVDAGYDWSKVEEKINTETREISENEKATSFFRSLGVVITRVTSAVKNTTSIFSDFISIGLDAFGDTFDLGKVSIDLENFANLIENITEKVRDYIKNNPKVKENLDVAFRIANNLYTALRGIIGSLGIIIDKYINSFLRTFDFQKIRTDIYALSRTLSTFFNNVFNYLKNDDKLEKAFDKSFQVINNLYRMISAIASIIIELLRSIGVVAGDTFGELDSGGDSIVEITDNIATWIEGLRDYIKENDSFITAIKNVIEFIKNIPNKIDTALTWINDKFKELTGIDLKDAFSELVSFLDEKFDKLSEKIQEFGGVFEFIKSIVNDVKQNGVGDTIKKFFEEFFSVDGDADKKLTNLEKVLKVVGTIAGIVGLIVGIVKTISKLSSIFKKPAEAVKSVGGIAGSTIAPVSNPRELLNVYSVLIKGVNGVISTLSNIATQAKNLISDLRKLTQTIQMGVVAASVLMLANAVIKLADVPIEKLGIGMVSLYLIMQMLAHMVKVFNQQIYKFDGKTIQDKAKAFALIVASFSVSVLILTKAMEKIAAIDDPWRAFGAWGMVELLLLTMIDTMSNIGSATNLDKITASASLFIVSMAVSINVLTKAVTKLAQLPLKNMIVATVVVVGLMEMYALVMKQMSDAASKFNYETKDIYAMAVSMIAFGTSMRIMASAIAVIADLNMSIDEALTNILSLASLVAAYVAAVVILQKANIDEKFISAFSVGVVLFGAAVLAIAKSLSLLAEVDTKALWNGVGAISAIIAALGLLVGVLAYINTSTAESVVLILYGVAASLASIGAMIFLAATGIGISANLMSKAVSRMVDALIKLADADLKGLEKNAIYISNFVKSLIITIATGIPMIAAGISEGLKTILQGLIESIPEFFEMIGVVIGSKISVFMGIIESFIKSLITGAINILKFLTEKNDNEQSIVEILGNLIVDIVLQIVGVLTSRNGEMAMSFVVWFISLINAIATAIKENAENIVGALENWWESMSKVRKVVKDKLIEAGKNAVDALLDGIKEKATDAYNAIREWVNNRIKNFKQVFGIEDGDSKSSALWKIGKGIIQCFIDGVKEMATDAFNAGSQFFNDFLDGLEDAFGDLEIAIGGFGQTILTKFKSSLEEESPSKATQKMGVYLLSGLKKGVTDTTENNSIMDDVKNLGKNVISKLGSELGVDKLKDEMTSTGELDFSKLFDGIDVDNDFSITPVIDMSEIDSGMDDISNKFSSTDYDLGLSTSTDLASSIPPSGYNSYSSSTTSNDISILADKVQTISDKMDRLSVYIDGNTLVGAISDRMNSSLGERQILAGRGVLT